MFRHNGSSVDNRQQDLRAAPSNSQSRGSDLLILFPFLLTQRISTLAAHDNHVGGFKKLCLGLIPENKLETIFLSRPESQ